MFLQLYAYRDFSRRSMAANSTFRRSICLKFELIPAFMIVLVTCKNKEDPIKNEGARVTRRLYIDFSDVQWQITPYSMVRCGRNSYSFEHLCMFLL